MGKQAVPYTATAWEMIGFDHGQFRIQGGSTLYEAVMFNASGRQQKVKLARLQPVEGMRVKEVSRYVDAETVLEVIKDVRQEEDED